VLNQAYQKPKSWIKQVCTEWGLWDTLITHAQHLYGNQLGKRTGRPSIRTLGRQIA